MAEVPPKIVELCLLIGAIVRAAALWGEDKAKARDDDFSANAVIACSAELLKFALGRPPTDEEIALVVGS